MTNKDYWQTIVGEQTPEEFLRTYGTADSELGLERFLEERGHFCGVLNLGNWVSTFEATTQYHILSVRVYLQSYLEETKEEWQPALEAHPPKVVRRYRPVYDFPIPKEDATEEYDDAETTSNDEAQATDDSTPEVAANDTAPEAPAADDNVEAHDTVEPVEAVTEADAEFQSFDDTLTPTEDVSAEEDTPQTSDEESVDPAVAESAEHVPEETVEQLVVAENDETPISNG